MKKNSECYNVAVLATMSSGKSTTLNAMFGSSILPSKNEACTATIFRVEDVDGMKKIKVRSTCNQNITSEWEVLKLNDNIIDSWNNLNHKQIDIIGDLPRIDNLSKRIVFHDTPGPNNSTEKSHSEIANSIFENGQIGCIICVLNVSCFGVDDEKALLVDLLNKTKNKEIGAKIVFVVNKIDQLDLEAGEDPLIILENITKYLTDLGFVDPLVIPVMSLVSLEIRLYIDFLRKKYRFPSFMAGIRKTKNPFSERKQKQILNNIKYLLEFDSYYSKALCSCSNKESVYKNMDYSIKGLKEKQKIKILDEIHTVSDFINADIITGIPILEKILEKELI
ncbi:MAG: hypothetical protein B6I17_03600 [Tenericutes bacterium 4572_104]|nr:MAG: hypothetical protein B6I17_03600 [Tenericutes bacterium 4572_104]